eukprot:2583776-Prymnesium_polylepis.1
MATPRGTCSTSRRARASPSSKASPLETATCTPTRHAPRVAQVCVYDTMCSNRESMWELKAGDEWHCDMEYKGYQFLFQTILNHTFNV